MDESSESRKLSTRSLLRIDGPVPGRLSHLHRRSIAVHFKAQGEDRLVLGEGVWEDDPQLGAILHIQFPDRAEDGEFLVLEEEWQGEVESGALAGCDFLIRLI